MRKTDFKLAGFIYKSVILAVLIAAVIIIAVKCGGNKKSDSKKELKIDETENVVTQIRKISEFVTAVYYGEIVLHYNKPSTKLIDRRKDEIVILAKGKVRAGLELSGIEKDDVEVNEDTVKLYLPQVKKIDAVVNPSDFEVYDESGKWSQNLVSQIESEAIEKLKADAIKSDILTKARISAEDKITALLKASGFKEVVLIIKD